MGYLEIRKKNKKVVNKTSSDAELTKLLKNHDFTPKLEVDGYLVYAFSNYKTLIKETESFYQKHILEKNIPLDDTLFIKMAKYIDDGYKLDKLEYYKRLFILDFLENKLENA